MRAFALVRKLVGDDGTHTEESAVWEAGDETGAQHDPVVGGECGAEVTDQDQDTKAEKNPFQGLRPGDQCQQGRPDAHAQRIGGDKMTGLRDRDAEIGRHVREDAHHDEFGNAQCEGTGSQCGQAFFHAG